MVWGGPASPGDPSLVQDLRDIGLPGCTGVLFSYEMGETLADVQGDAGMALVAHGGVGGEALVIAGPDVPRACWVEETPYEAQLWLKLVNTRGSAKLRRVEACGGILTFHRSLVWSSHRACGFSPSVIYLFAVQNAVKYACDIYQ